MAAPRVGLCCAAALLAGMTAAAPAGDAADARWRDLPPVGRSLFDHLTAEKDGTRHVQRVPLPFDALLAELERRVAPDALGQPGVKAVLIPIGRSLQRNAAPGEFFKYPRVVAAVVGEARAGAGAPAMLLKDRLYLGYHEKAALLEVISYNEAAGRFEFQVVKDYRPGGRPQVFYANRTVCLACHQNAAPIFSRPTWDETNANPMVARQLLAQRHTYFGVPVARGVDLPNAIDDATERANLYAAAQTLWREGCEGGTAAAAACRSHAFMLALKYRLSGAESVDAAAARHRDAFVVPMRRSWAAKWPRGLPIANPDIPNRDPFAGMAEGRALDRQALLRAAEIRPAFDPLLPRAPSAIWGAEAPGSLERYVKVLAEFIAEQDVKALDGFLARQRERTASARRKVVAPCTLRAAAGGHIDLQCAASGLKLAGRLQVGAGRISGGTLERVEFGDGQAVRGIALAAAPLGRQGAARRAEIGLAREGLRARLPDAKAIEAMTLTWREGTPGGEQPASVELALVDDFAIVAGAVEKMASDARNGGSNAFAARPFRRAAVMRALFTELGIDAGGWCCDEPPAGMSAPQVDTGFAPTAPARPAALEVFYRHCSACHDSNEASPPGFLHGAAEAVTRQLGRCAERILYRLDMWQVAAAERAKTPMPPTYAAEAAPPPHDLAHMREYATELIVAAGGRQPDASGHRQRRYESLAACR